jgi:hypothetical protein
MDEIKIKNIKNYQSKNGDIKTYVYDQKLYNNKFYNLHKEKLNTCHKCSLCGGSFSITNKSKHLKTKKHINIL